MENASAAKLLHDLANAIDEDGNLNMLINGSEKIIAVYVDKPEDGGDETWSKFIAIDTQKMTDDEMKPYLRQPLERSTP